MELEKIQKAFKIACKNCLFIIALEVLRSNTPDEVFKDYKIFNCANCDVKNYMEKGLN